MIKFKNLKNELPYILLKNKYDQAKKFGQKSIEAISISSYNIDKKEVNSRYVNIKYIINDEFIFFSNYNSPKAQSFKTHDQIAALFYWSKINLQIRIKANIKNF